jgi:hypothetical protein
MDNPMTIRELLERHYEGLSGKGGPDPSLSDSFLLTGTQANVARGRDAFANSMFFRLVKNLKVKTMIIDVERACVVVNYSLVSPKGDSLSCDVAEIWEMKNGKLDSLAMYFDTAAYQKFMLPILFPLTRFKRKK